MLAKVIASGESREAARKRAAAALRSFPILGVRSNVPFLINVLEHPAFAAGDVHTGFIDEHMDNLLETGDTDDIVSAVAAFARSAPPATGGRAAGHGHDPWSTITRWGR
jgi:acetyl/propionyl-CoA carboxylase alpha subunit